MSDVLQEKMWTPLIWARRVSANVKYLCQHTSPQTQLSVLCFANYGMRCFFCDAWLYGINSLEEACQVFIRLFEAVIPEKKGQGWDFLHDFGNGSIGSLNHLITDLYVHELVAEQRNAKRFIYHELLCPHFPRVLAEIVIDFLLPK